ncbi:hypothetical protein Q5752_006480 [Cryptotrichosporon argae]
MQGLAGYADDSDSDGSPGPPASSARTLPSRPTCPPPVTGTSSPGPFRLSESDAAAGHKRPAPSSPQHPPKRHTASSIPTSSLAPEPAAAGPSYAAPAAPVPQDPDAAAIEVMDDDALFRHVTRPPAYVWELLPPPAPAEDASLQLRAKVEHFLSLKEKGQHINTSLMASSSFSNPHIYAKLVEFVDIDDTASAVPSLTRTNIAALVPTHGPRALFAQQDAMAAAVRVGQGKGRREIGFVGARTEGREKDERRERRDVEAPALNLSTLYPSPTSTYNTSPFFPAQASGSGGASANVSPYTLTLDAAKATYAARAQAPLAEVRWHEHHCDPNAELVLVAVDGVYFRASRWNMARTSALINELTPNQTSTPILTPAPSPILHLYLCTALTAFPVPGTVCASTLVALFHLARFFRADAVGALALAALAARCPFEPWPAFVFAAATDDVALAREALKFMGTAQRPCPIDMLNSPALDLADLLAVNHVFLKEAIRLRLAGGGAGLFADDDDGSGYKFRDWGFVADQFDPHRTRRTGSGNPYVRRV